jgi:hypothetical protein
VTRHIFLTYAEPKKVISTLVIVSLLLVGLYFYFGRMTFYLWVLSIAVVIGFVQAVRQLYQRGPVIIINSLLEAVSQMKIIRLPGCGNL